MVKVLLEGSWNISKRCFPLRRNQILVLKLLCLTLRWMGRSTTSSAIMHGHARLIQVVIVRRVSGMILIFTLMLIFVLYCHANGLLFQLTPVASSKLRGEWEENRSIFQFVPQYHVQQDKTVFFDLYICNVFASLLWSNVAFRCKCKLSGAKNITV